MKLRAAGAALLLSLALPFPIHAFSDTDATPTPTPGFLDKTLEALHLKSNAQPKETKPTPTPTPSYVDKALEALHLKHPPQPGNAPQTRHQIEMKLDLSPTDIKLNENRQVQVTVSLFNHSKNYLDLTFPTTQRIEVLVRDGSGKVVNTWSEDQSFTNDPAAVTVNPGERLEYTVSVATREMNAGQPYTIEASFPSYPQFKIQQKVIPQK
jgi:hypothetical protein